MLKLILSRLLQGVVVLLVVSVVTFALLAAAGGDALTALRNDPSVKEETIERQRRIYGLDQPLAVRYVRWLSGTARGEMGWSISFDAPVRTILWPRLLNTLSLAVVALLLAWTIALSLGSMAARHPQSWIDKLCGALILLAASTPRIVLALVALAIAARTSLFSIGAEAGGAGGSLLNLLLPAFVLSVPLIALFLAQVRDGLGSALQEEFVQVARSKGLSERVVTLRHALRAALNPLITIFGYSLGGLISGSVIVERVFNRKGLGDLSVDALRSRDVPLLMGVVLVTSTAVLIGNLLADILLRFNDPRLREDETRQTTSARVKTASPAA
ncbi:MAG: peptide/nickel transport system permease protein [Acidobacteriota bacterium]|nr:peptide/nickel transport system permease protein [Acidobacteriota bacterium]